MYIYSSGLATDVNKYSLASARCQPIWRTLVDELDLFLAVAKDCGIVVYLKQSQQSISPCFGYVGHMRWHLPVESLAAVVLPL